MPADPKQETTPGEVPEWACDELPDQIEDIDGEEGECGLMPGGQCRFAGTEACDFDCGRLH